MPFEGVPRGWARKEFAPRAASLASVGEVLIRGTVRDRGGRGRSSVRRPGPNISPRGRAPVSLGTTDGSASPSGETRGQIVAVTSGASRFDQDPAVKCVR
jgi:hypothetical protein